MFGRRTTFGKQQLSFAQVKDVIQDRTPDDDGVMRVIPKAIWDDPKIGAMLRECGFMPDDPRNISRTAEDYGKLFDAAAKRLQARVEAFNREMTARHGYCQAVPFLVVDRPVWDGEHGSFLYANMELVPYDDWNVLMLAADMRTKQVCGLAGHPGPIPQVTDMVIQHVTRWKARVESALEAYGVTAVPGSQGHGGGITREQFEAEKDAVRQDILDQIAVMKPRIADELMRIQV
ncbi:MAG: hypothetical protein WCE79_16050 [Xanthobacteraceae bacterium]